MGRWLGEWQQRKKKRFGEQHIEARNICVCVYMCVSVFECMWVGGWVRGGKDRGEKQRRKTRNVCVCVCMCVSVLECVWVGGWVSGSTARLAMHGANKTIATSYAGDIVARLRCRHTEYTYTRSFLIKRNPPLFNTTAVTNHEKVRSNSVSPRSNLKREITK